MSDRYKTHDQKTPNDSPWTLSHKLQVLLWQLSWKLLCSWTPKPANSWRLFWLKLFGARILGQPFVHQRARILFPWNLTLHHRSCLGDRADAYSLGEIEVLERATVAQEAYLCTGTHAFDLPSMALRTAKITIGANAFIGARAFIMPGVVIGENAIVGACSVVTSDVSPSEIVAGNPARTVKTRVIYDKA